MLKKKGSVPLFLLFLLFLIRLENDIRATLVVGGGTLGMRGVK